MTTFFAARRKVGGTWREAVAARGEAFGVRTPCLEAFDAYSAAGHQDFEAAYLALRDFGGLWSIKEPENSSSMQAQGQEKS